MPTRCIHSHCVEIAECWHCYGLHAGWATARQDQALHLARCNRCNPQHNPQPAAEMEEEDEQLTMGAPTTAKVMVSAYNDAYGVRLPNQVTLRQLNAAWAESVSHIPYDSLSKAVSRNPKMSSWMLKNRIIPREWAIKLHNQLVRAAKAKPIPVPELPIPDFDGTSDFSLLKMIGVEFEGGWYGDRIEHLRGQARLKRDSSVTGLASRFPDQTSGDGNEQETCDSPDCDYGPCIAARNAPTTTPTIATDSRHRQSFYVGEMEFGPWKAQTFATDWADKFASYHPEEVNATCGQHVHFSFISSGVYGAFVREDFRPWLMKGLSRWAERSGAGTPELANRIAGRNNYCKQVYSPEQLWNAGDRYGQVNYCAQKHGTMEIRVLPMFLNPAQSEAAITELARLVAVWANAFAPRVRKPILLASAEAEEGGGGAEGVVGPPDWLANFDPLAPIECPNCGHDINACRGYVQHGHWRTLLNTLRGWHREGRAAYHQGVGSILNCCNLASCTGNIRQDSYYAQVLQAIYDGRIA